MSERDELAVRRKLVAAFLAQLAQRGFVDELLAVLFAFVNLSGGKFPDRRADRDALLPDEQKSSILGLRRDDRRALAMHDCPRARLLRPRGRARLGAIDLQIRIFKQQLARERLPAFAVADEIVEVHFSSNKSDYCN